MEFGLILRPLRDLANQQTTPSRQALLQAFAVLGKDERDWWNHAGSFASVQEGHLGFLRDNIVHIWGSTFMSFRYDLANPDSDLDMLHSRLRQLTTFVEEQFYKLIDMVPVTWEFTLSERDMPFTFYHRMLDAIWPARQKLYYFDRYVKSDFYDLYLARLDRGLEIRIVTTAGNANYGVKSIDAVSKKACGEFSNYQLIQVTQHDIHDRNLRADDQVFSLGPSVVDAGAQPTNFGPVTNTIDAIRILDGIIANGSIVHRS